MDAPLALGFHAPKGQSKVAQGIALGPKGETLGPKGIALGLAVEIHSSPEGAGQQAE